MLYCEEMGEALLERRESCSAQAERRLVSPDAPVLHWHTVISQSHGGGGTMSAVLTVRLSDEEAAALERLTRISGKSRSDLVRDALRSQALRENLRLLHEDLGPQARLTGWLTEDDILRDVS
jgi:predicted transcriptional regulator